MTPEQQKRFDALQTAQDGAPAAATPTAARVYVPGPDGKPQAVSIMVGLSDGSYSEVVSGDLKAGQERLRGLGVRRLRASQPDERPSAAPVTR